ncbi:MFS transporter [Oleiharenicola lentus]|uniref:MFS transporter n=1 Tax=Oleiharenicola lentus TaxID=2508720 RepID=A0A4Q1C7K7_9BACT|nr:MFS transporter [Oleiharenicola lentus]RXK54907.1 MFS transporter [Oleiharenicola lentus]
MSQNQENKLPFREMLAFGCGDFASVLYWQTFMKYLPFFYTDVFGITAGALATMLLVSRIWDGINDPIIGMWADRTESRWGKFRPFILFGCVPFAIFGVLTFTTPSLGMSGKLIWAYLTYNGLMMLYTTVNIPYTALMGVMTSNPVERTRLSSIKFMFAFSAGMVISATLLPMVSALGGDKNPQLGWQLAFAVVGVVAIGFFLITVFGTKERIKPAPEENTSVLRDIRFLVTNNAWVLLLCTTLTWILFVALRSSVSAHYFKYYLYNGSPETPLSFMGREFSLEVLLSSFNTLGQAASVAGVFVVSLVASKFPKKGLFISLFTLQIFTTAAYLVLEPGQLGAIFVLEIVGSFLGAPLPVLMWAMYADTADYGEWKSGRRTTALVFSASTMSQKFGWALAAFIAFQLLQFVGFQANVIPSDAVKGSLVRLMSIYPAALGVLSIVIFLFYPLNEKRMAEIDSDLKARRAKAGLATA